MAETGQIGRHTMIDQLIDTLHAGKHSLVVCNGSVYTYDDRGVSDLYRLYTTEPQILRDATLADKVVGKGAAALMVLGKVKEIYADTISRPALSLLESNNVSVTYATLVDNIINRQGSGICPVETVCLDCQTAEECLPKITAFMLTFLHVSYL